MNLHRPAALASSAAGDTRLLEMNLNTRDFVVIMIMLIICLIIAVVVVGNDDINFRKICSNNHHKLWTGKEPKDFVKFAFPKPNKEILNLCSLRRGKNPKVCIECKHVAEQQLAMKNDTALDASRSSKPVETDDDRASQPGPSGFNTSPESSTPMERPDGCTYQHEPGPSGFNIQQQPFTTCPSPVANKPVSSNEDLPSFLSTVTGSTMASIGSALLYSTSKLSSVFTTASHKQALPSYHSPSQTQCTLGVSHSKTGTFPSAPSGWTHVGDENYRSYCKVSSAINRDPIFAMSLTIYCDFTWKLRVLGKEVNHMLFTTLQRYPEVLDAKLTMDLLTSLHKLNVCPGIPDARFMCLVKEGKVGKLNLCNDRVIYKDELFEQTLRPKDCSILIADDDVCAKCRSVRPNLRAMLSNSTKRKSTDDACTTTSSTVTFKTLRSTALLRERCRNLSKSRKLLQDRVQRQYKRLEQLTKKDGVDLGSTTSHSLQTIIDENSSSIESLHPEGTFGRLFWEQQKEAAKARGPRGHRWHPMFIKWCIHLKMVSTKAYNSVSSVLKLPCMTTLRDYTHWTEARSGLTLPSLKQLCREIKMKDRQSHEKYVVIVHDEMKIRSDLVYQKSTGRMVGFVNLGDFQNKLRGFTNAIRKSTKPEECMAKHMFVIMVRGLFWNFTYPLAYYPTTNTSGDEIFELVWDSIEVLTLAGFKVAAVSCDGASTNRTFCDLHGTDTVPLSSNEPVFKTPMPYTPDEDYATELFLLQDPPHLLKCVRNAWANSFGHAKTRTLWNGSNISWTTIEDLYKADVQMDGLYLIKKLSYEHVHLTSYSKMKVNYAAQILSTTVADALESYYGPAEANTVEFVRVFDKFFDLLNIRSRREYFVKRKDHLKEYEDPTDPRFEWLEQDFVGYLDAWRNKVDTEKSHLPRGARNKMLIPNETLTGLYRTARAFPQLGRYLLRQPGVEFLLSERVNQDPLENFFGNQRQMRGGNDAPSAAQMGASVNAARVKSSLHLKNFGGNSRQLACDYSIDSTSIPKRQRKK